MMQYHASKEHPQREYPAMATITLRTVVESDEEFEDFLATVRAAMQRHSRWAYAQGYHPTEQPDGVTDEEAEVKLEWSLSRLDRWRSNQNLTPDA